MYFFKGELDGINDEDNTINEQFASKIFNELGVDNGEKISKKQFIDGYL